MNATHVLTVNDIMHLLCTQQPAWHCSIDAEPTMFANSENSSGRSGILIVEDEPVLAECIQISIDGLGYCTHVASHARAAYEICTTFPVGLIFSDIIMPGTDIFSTLLAIKKHFPATKIVLMSGILDWSPYVAKISALNPCCVLQKPFSLRRFGKIISEQMPLHSMQ